MRSSCKRPSSLDDFVQHHASRLPEDEKTVASPKTDGAATPQAKVTHGSGPLDRVTIYIAFKDGNVVEIEASRALIHRDANVRLIEGGSRGRSLQ